MPGRGGWWEGSPGEPGPSWEERERCVGRQVGVVRGAGGRRKAGAAGGARLAELGGGHLCLRQLIA